MKSRWSFTAGSAVALFVGFLFGVNFTDQPAVAQPRQSFGNGRFQLSAYAGTVGDTVHHGCYVMDSSTGQVWHVPLGGNAERVADRLP